MKMSKILVTDRITSEAVSMLKEKHDVEEFLDWEPDDLLEKIKDVEVLVVRSRTKVKKELIDAGKRLRIIARAGAGLDNIDVDYAKKKGIQVLNTPTANLLSVAEMTLGLAIALLRNMPRADKGMKEGLWEKKKLRGMEVSRKTWGVVGLGNVGKLLAGLLGGFNCQILAYDPYVSEEAAVGVGAKLVPLEDLLKDSDIVSVHVPLLDSTRGMIGSKELSLMKESAIIINISRGGIIDEKALHGALKDGAIKGAALDVFEKEPPTDSPLPTLRNILLTPHLGGSTEEAQERVGREIAEKVIKALE